jgi:signal transduction histidine kinase
MSTAAGTPRTDAWVTTVHLLLGLWAGFVAFLVLGWLVPLGVGLLPLFALGVPLLIVAFWLARWFGAFERRRYRTVLGAQIATPPRPAGLLGPLRDTASWREVGYALLRFPVSAVEIVLVAAAWLVPPAALSLPIWNWSLPGGGLDLVLLVLVAAAGLYLLFHVTAMVRGLGAADLAFGQWLLGTHRLARRVGELERSRAAVVVSAEEERRRIERDLHDGAQQRLVALAMQLGRARSRFDADPAGAKELVDEAHSEAKLALAELRDLARGLHPAVLTDRGLDAALSGLAARSPVPVAVEVDPAAGATPVPVVDAIAYFVVAEALTNVAKHAEATKAAVVVRRLDGMIRVVISDDGIGGADPATGTGLRGLADRVSGVDGRLHVVSPPGGPTVLTVELPCGS